VRDVDHDPRRAGEPEDAKARLTAQPEAERDETLEVAGVPDLEQVGATRRDDARQEVGSALRVSTGIADEYAYALGAEQRHGISRAVLKDSVDVAHVIAGSRRSGANHEPIER